MTTTKSLTCKNAALAFAFFLTVSISGCKKKDITQNETLTGPAKKDQPHLHRQSV
ncbi:hypothetical protein ACUN24_24125 [Pedobacter sp. WC2501]|uniref:hypothetical protein n=1 Tax=Pedobacter sp. WC2501 TaxID=3461400 RepID=UPI0040453E68